ncbi:MAG: LysR family transcriptional regulator [Lachnospiraceae bacterium]|nr:LysR family transcriptional regulator [Lachnospiraceae bacterium]
MEIRYLHEFRVLAEICNYQEAADRLYISLSTLSKHISKLEAELGATLFTRSTRKVSLNKYGKAFYHYAVEITNSYHACTNRLEELQLGDALALRVSFTPPLTEYCLPRLLEEFMDGHPDIRVSVTEHAEPRRLLEEKLCDVAFQTEYGLPENKSAGSDPDNRLDLDTLVAVLPQGHPLAGKKSVSIEELKKDRFVIQNDLSSELSKIFHRLCAGAGFEPDIACAVRYASAMPRMAAALQGSNHHKPDTHRSLRSG